MEIEHVSCPICGPSLTRIWLNDDKPTSYVQCITCKTVYASPRYAKKLRHAQTGDAWAYTEDLIKVEARRRPALQLEAELLQKHISSGRLLDVGCSAGDFFDFFSETAWERFGVELSASTAAYTSQKKSVQVAAGTLLDTNFPDGHFDLVSMIDMFYYSDDPLADLVEAKRILKPSGLLAIEIAGQAYMFMRSRGLIALALDGKWCRLSSDSHLYWFDPSGLSLLLNKAGLIPVAWYVIPSPRHQNTLFNFMADLHYSILKSFGNLTFRTLTWAPKYLCLVRPMDTHP